VIKSRWFSVRSRPIVFRHLGELRAALRPDVIISEQAVRNLDLLPLLTLPRSTRPLVALWGHGMTPGGQQGAAMERYKEWLTLRSDWFFAYNAAGGEWAQSLGYPSERITVFNNSTDTRGLISLLENVKHEDLNEFVGRNQLVAGKTGIFLGGLDGAKRLDLLLDAAERVAAVDAEFVLLVAGSGVDADRVRTLAGVKRWLRYLGRLDGEEKAVALASSDFIMIPDNIGLIATDSFAAGKPIVTTAGTSHGPEFAYLTDDVTALIGEPDIAQYVASVTRLMHDPELLGRLSKNCLLESQNYSLELMADLFVNGVVAMCGPNSD
ncbi:MAG: glycosyltransferase family 4 protein, partial [Propionicimonas sp.]